jgi:hypothetical protein
MATKDYTKTANTALKLIKKFGLPSEFIRNEGAPSVDPWEPPPVPLWQSYPCQAVKVPAGQKDVVFLPEGTSISTTAKILIDAVEFTETPQIADRVKHKGIEYQITAIKPLSPADVDVMWTVYATV